MRTRTREAGVHKDTAGREMAGFHRPSGALIRIMESLILAQNERWRRVLSMQVVRDCGACPA